MTYQDMARRTNMALAAILFLSSVVLLGLAAWIAANPAPPIPLPQKPASKMTLDVCDSQLRALGYLTTQNSGSITAREQVITDLQSQIARASVAILACKGFSLKQFCAGADCKPGVSFTLVAPR